MKRWWVIVTMVVVVAAVALLARPRAPEWTTSSPEARSEFEAGLAAMMKYYWPDARRHFEAALRLDPGFIMAKLHLAEVLEGPGDKDERGKLFEEVRAADLTRLTAREQFMVSYDLARVDRNEQAAIDVLERFVAGHPNDPFGLNALARREETRGDWAAAEESYEHLAKVAPNWVTPYNNLGYMLMAQGRFDEAEDMLRKYRFIAPDQANPHDSLGELLTIVGRYDEAEQEFRDSLRARPDFSASLEHLVTMYLVSGQVGRAEAAVEQARVGGVYPPDLLASLGREVAVARATYADDWRAVLDAAQWKPGKEMEAMSEWVHLALCRLGRFDEARGIEGSFAAQLEKAGVRAEMMKTSWLPASVPYLEGVRLAVQGDYGPAIARLTEADGKMFFYGMGPGIPKLFNLAWLAQAQDADGDSAQASATLDRLRRVNPSFAAAFGGPTGLIVHLTRR